MKFLFTVLITLMCSSELTGAESVVIVNRTKDVFRTVWVREYQQPKYERVYRTLWSGQAVRIYVENMPFYVAVSGRNGSFSFVGPYNSDELSKSAARIEILEKDVYETRTKETQVWCPIHRRWETRIREYKVSKAVPEVKISGLVDALEGASMLRDTESLEGYGASQSQ